jgi:type VI secretion system protein ImpE
VSARGLYQAGQLDEAIEALGAEVRDNPSDAQRRTFLFELLCFAGKYDRAEKQLAVLGQGGKEAQMGALVYQSALHAERLRQDMFDRSSFPGSAAPRPVRGTLNGRPFESLEDADPRLGARLEVFAAGQYTWIPFAQIASVRAEAPRRLREALALGSGANRPLAEWGNHRLRWPAKDLEVALAVAAEAGVAMPLVERLPALMEELGVDDLRDLA